MPRRPLIALKWTAAEIKQRAQISAADVQNADEAWRRQTRADARDLLHALPEPVQQKAPQKKKRR